MERKKRQSEQNHPLVEVRKIQEKRDSLQVELNRDTIRQIVKKMHKVSCMSIN